MDVFSMVVLIVAVSCGAGMYNNYLKTKRLRGDVDGIEQYQEEIDDLRGRIEVLEKIVTDEKYELSRELNELER